MPLTVDGGGSAIGLLADVYITCFYLSGWVELMEMILKLLGSAGAVVFCGKMVGGLV